MSQRRSRRPSATVVLFLGVLLVAGCSSESPTTTQPERVSVEYRVYGGGDGSLAWVTFSNGTGGSSTLRATLPWSHTVTLFRGDTVYLSAEGQTLGGNFPDFPYDGLLGCSIVIDNVPRYSSDTAGPNAVCTAQGAVP